MDQLSEASLVRKEKLGKHVGKMEQETEVKLKSTVVDIDSVRDNEVKDENVGLLEAAEQEDSESVFLFFKYMFFMSENVMRLLHVKDCQSFQV